MWKVHVIVVLCWAILAFMPMVHSTGEEPKAVEEWFKNLSQANQKVTKLHFYVHDGLSGNNPTMVQVAKSNLTTKPPYFFGSVVVLDDLLTVGPEPTSKPMGRAQGLYALDGLDQLNLLMAMNLVFTDGKYNGSTLSLTVLGHNPVLHQYREMPIVGGSGIFRLAQGIATAKTYFFTTTTGNTIVEYNVIAIHY